MSGQKSFNHLAIICDGNRRWARAQGLPAFEGHKYAVKKVFEPLIEHAIKLKIKYLTFWIFSTENWQRDKQEVEVLLQLFRYTFDHQIDKFHQKDVRVKVIGNKAMFPKDIQERIKKGEAKTKNNKTLTVQLAMSYGGTDELLRAMRKLIAKIPINKLQIPSKSQFLETQISKDLFESYLDTAGIPDPDLIVRTSGEQRLSGFMPWQSTYSELYFPKWNFPEFTPARLDECLAEYERRQRRFGK